MSFYVVVWIFAALLLVGGIALLFVELIRRGGGR